MATLVVEDKREKIQALSLAKDCYSMKLELLSNTTVVDDAMKFTSTHKNESEAKSNYADILAEWDTQKFSPSENITDSIKTHNKTF